MLPYQTDKTVVARQMKACKDRGVNWVRISFQWHLLQPEKKPINWTMVDYAVQQAAANGVNILGIIGGSPIWANGGKEWDPPTNIAEWQAFCSETFTRYPSIKTWEIWNEENYDYWRGTPAAYVELVEATPKLTGNKHIMGGLGAGSAIMTDYLETLLKLGIANYVDAVAYHPYAWLLPVAWWLWFNKDPQEQVALTVLKAVKDMVKKYSPSKPLEVWLTEFGYTTSGFPWWETTTEQLQADYWVRTRRCYDGQVDALFCYDLWCAAPPDQWWGGMLLAVNHYGCLRYDFTPKPIWNVFL